MRGTSNSTKEKSDGYFTRNSDLRRSTGQMKDKRVDQLRHHPPNLNLKDISNTSKAPNINIKDINTSAPNEDDGVQYPTSPSVHHLIKGFQNRIGNGNSKPTKVAANPTTVSTSSKASVKVTSTVSSTKTVKAITTVAVDTTQNDSNYKTPGYVVESSLPADRSKRVNSTKRKLSIRSKKNKSTTSDDNTRYNIIQSLGMSAFETNENRCVEKSFSFFDIQALFFDIQNGASLKCLYEDGSTYTKKLSGASAASQRNTSRKRLKSGDVDPATNKILSRAESLVDEGDNKENHLLLSCPYFRNEIAEPEESPDNNTQIAKYGKDISKLISMFNRNRSFENLSSSSTRNSRRQRKSQAYEEDILLEGVCDDSHFFTWDEPKVNEKQIFDFEHIDRGAMYYKQFFAKQEHFNLFGIDEKYGPMAISIVRELLPKMAVLDHSEVSEKSNKKYQYRIIFRTCELYTLRIAIMENSIPSTSRHGGNRLLPLKDILEYCFPEVQLSCLRHCAPGPKIPQLLMKLDQQQLSTTYKIGLLYCKASQKTEEEMYNNEHGGSEFLEFCSIIADTVSLKGFQGYRAQLDNKNDSTGQHSLYTVFHGREMMFHVSTKLPYTAHDRQQLLRKRHIGNDIVTVVFQETGAEPFTPQVMRSHFQHVFVVVRVENPHTDHTKYEVAVTRSRDVPYFGPPIPPDKFDGSTAFREFLLSKLINAENSAHKSEKFTHMARRTRYEYLKDLATNHVSQQTLEVPSKFGFSFTSKKKEKTHPAVNPEIWLQGGLVWTVKFDFEHDGPGSSAFLSISTKAIVFVEQSTQKVLVSIPCKHVLGWRTTSHTLKLFYDSGKMAFFTLVEEDVNELPFVVNRLKAVTPGCETMDLTLRRNVDGQLGFHVFYEGLVAEVEPYGLAWQAGLRKGSRLLEISGHIVGNMTHERMILMLKRPGVVRIVVLPPAPDGQPRNYKAVRNLRRYSSMTSVYSMSVPNLAGGYSSSGMSSSKEYIAMSSESPNDHGGADHSMVNHRPRSLSMEKLPTRNDSGNSISDESGETKKSSSEGKPSSIEKSSSNESQNLLNISAKSQERLITSRSATELPSLAKKDFTPSPVLKKKVMSPNASGNIDVELGEIERALTDTRKSIDAKFFRSLANSSSPFFKPGKTPALTSPDENENLSDDNDRPPSSLGYHKESDFEYELMRVNSPMNCEWTVTKKYDITDKSSDDSKDATISPPQPPPKTYQHAGEKNNATANKIEQQDVSNQQTNINMTANVEKNNREVKSPPVPPKPTQSKQTVRQQAKVSAVVLNEQLPAEQTSEDIIVLKETTVIATTPNISVKVSPPTANQPPVAEIMAVSNSPIPSKLVTPKTLSSTQESDKAHGTSTQSIVTANQGIVTVSASNQGVFAVSTSKDGVVTVSASNINARRKSGSYISSANSVDDHGSYSDSSMRSQETLTSEKDSDSQRGSLVRTKVRDAKDIINERSQHKDSKSKVRDVVQKANSFDNTIDTSSDTTKQQRTSLPSNKFLNDKDTNRNMSPTQRLHLRDKALVTAVESGAKQKPTSKEISSSEPALKNAPLHHQPMRKYKSENQTKEMKDVNGKFLENTAKFDESLNETFAKLDAAFGFRRHNGVAHNHHKVEPAPRDEKRKKKKNSRRRSRNFEPPSSDSSEELDIESKRRSRNLRRQNLDDDLSVKSLKSEAEESLEAAISDFRISLSDMQDDRRRDSLIKCTMDARLVDREHLVTNNKTSLQTTTSVDLLRDNGVPADPMTTSTHHQQQKQSQLQHQQKQPPPLQQQTQQSPRHQQPQKLAYVKTIPVNTVQASSINRPVSDGAAILSMSTNTEAQASDSNSDPKNRSRSRSEAKITMRNRQCASPTPRQCISPTPRSETSSNNNENVRSKKRKSTEAKVQEKVSNNIETVEDTTIIETVILEDEILPTLPPLPFIPLSPTRGGIQTLPDRNEKRRRGTDGDLLGKSSSASCIPLVIRGLDLAAASNISSTGPWSKEDLHVMLTVMETELEQEREEKERLSQELDRSREERERLLEQSKQAESQLRKFTSLFLDQTPQGIKTSETYTDIR